MGFVRSQASAGANQGGKGTTVTSACPSLVACTALAKRHGSASAKRAGWAACVTKILASAHLGLVLVMPPA